VNPALLPAVRLPKRAQRHAHRLANRSAHAADFSDLYGPTQLEPGSANEILFSVLDVSGASTSPGAPVIDWWDKNYLLNDANQQWTIKPVQYGYYIVNQNSGQCLTSDGVAGDQTYKWPCVGSLYQMWYGNTYPALEDGYAGSVADTWQNVASGLYLDVYGGDHLPGGTIDTWYWNGGDNQYFGEGEF
jgi:Ricin-type beta-trefoil lectin domain-like